MSRVLVVDDQLPLLRTLGENLSSRGYAVEYATTGGQALERTELAPADAVILDLGLPDISGMEVLARLRGWTSVPVIVLSARTAEIQKVAALDAGANDYVTKPFGMDELMARLRVALRTPDQSGGEPVIETEHFTIDLAAQRITRAGQRIRLTRTEWQIVRLLTRNPGCLVTHRQLLADVWGLTDIDSNNYIRVFLVSIRRKLEPDPAHPRYFITEPGCGVCFQPSGPGRFLRPIPGNPGTQGPDGPVEYLCQALRGRPAVDHREEREIPLPAGVVHGLQPGQQLAPERCVVGTAEDVRVVRRQCRDGRGGLRRGGLDAGGEGRAGLVTDDCDEATVRDRGVAPGAFGGLVPGHPPHAGAEVRVLRQLGQLRPRLDLLRLGGVGQFGGH
jgi:two-component system, OmpR family, KDP operon response regulator KdpE